MQTGLKRIQRMPGKKEKLSVGGAGGDGEVQVGLERIHDICKRDNWQARSRLLAASLVLLALIVCFLCLRSTELGMINPLQMIKNTVLYIRLFIAGIFDLPVYADRRFLIQDQPYYYETVSRIIGMGKAVVLGAVLAVAGVVFQVVFRNPIATPSMLGTTNGVKVTNMILVLQYSTLGASMIVMRFVYAYISSAVTLAVLLLLAKVMSKKKAVAADLLLLGTVFFRIATQIVNYVQSYVLEDDDYVALLEMNMYGTDIRGYGTLIVMIAVVASLVPLFLVRMSLNVLSFGDDDARCLGIRGTVLRGTALLCSVVLSTTAVVVAGDIAMLSMLVPIVCRYIFGADTRRLITGCALSGAILMMVCRFVTAFFAFDSRLYIISEGIIIQLVSAPLLIFVIFRNKRGWE